MRTRAVPVSTLLPSAVAVVLGVLAFPSLAIGDQTGSEPSRRAASRGVADVEINPDGYTSARVCGQCHTDIYDSWKNSLHAFALSDPIFDTAYMQAIRASGDEARRICLRCHAPMTLINQDYDLRQGVTREGVSCDFCHTVTAVHLDRRDRPFSTEPGLVKRSVLRQAESPAHEVAFSELHGTSELCGGCHNYVAANGVAIMSTYDEWKSGPYAREGIQCQNCHMVRSAGHVVNEEVKVSGDEIHLHSLIHDSDQLRSALTIQILRAERTPSGLEVDIQIENVGSGHKVPTGVPTREVVLTVTADSAGHSRTQERRYRKVVADEKGRILKQDFEALLYGARVLTDNRIGPRETRLERITFPASRRTERVKVTATLSYVYAPMILDQRRLDVALGQDERFVF